MTYVRVRLKNNIRSDLTISVHMIPDSIKLAVVDTCAMATMDDEISVSEDNHLAFFHH